jgi:hypothetical protein
MTYHPSSNELLTNISPVSETISISGLSKNSSSIQPAMKGTLPGFEDVTIYISTDVGQQLAILET